MAEVFSSALRSESPLGSISLHRCTPIWIFIPTQRTVGRLAKQGYDAIWPDDEIARTELFRLLNWNYAEYGRSSKVSVLRCIPIKEQTVACELSASLSWLNESKAIEAVFEGAANDWHLMAVKSR
ncbi:hypothetical protein [Ochrobactrum teleogrylli]